MSYFELELDYIHCPARYIINLCKQPIFLIRLFQYSFSIVQRRIFPKFVCPRVLYDCWKYNITLAIYNFPFTFRAVGYDEQFWFRRIEVKKCVSKQVRKVISFINKNRVRWEAYIHGVPPVFNASSTYISMLIDFEEY